MHWSGNAHFLTWIVKPCTSRIRLFLGCIAESRGTRVKSELAKCQSKQVPDLATWSSKQIFRADECPCLLDALRTKNKQLC